LRQSPQRPGPRHGEASVGNRESHVSRSPNREDRKPAHPSLESVGFFSNTGTSVKANEPCTHGALLLDGNDLIESRADQLAWPQRPHTPRAPSGCPHT